MELLQGGQILQLRNRYGTARYYRESADLVWITGSQVAGSDGTTASYIPIDPVRQEPYSVSPDGSWLCYVRKTAAASGQLIIKDTRNFTEVVLASGTEYSLEQVPVRWSPDSSILVYEKQGAIYFTNPKNAFASVQISETYRKIGIGKIANVYWPTAKTLVYIYDDLVYTISSNEMYTRALYSDMVGIGKNVGRLPYSFDENRDRFWTSDDGLEVVMLQNNRTLWYMELDGTDFSFVSTLFSYPFVNVPGTAIRFDVFWTPVTSGVQVPVIWISQLKNGVSESYVYRLKRNDDQQNVYFSPLPMPVTVSKPQLSPDGTLLAFIGEQGIHVYDLARWKQLYALSDEKIVNYVWADSSSLYLGGTETVRYWQCASKTLSTLFLSSAQRYAWSGTDGDIVVGNSAGYFVYNDNLNTWSTSKTVITRKAVTQNPYWRVFSGESANRYFSNALYIRSLTGQTVTKPLFPDSARRMADRPKVALAFDAFDNADGLTHILATLQKYGLKTTFFVNGEFLRRYGNAVQEIVAAGHECGSLFFTSADLTASGFVVDEDFVRRGLARNEDEFFSRTGSELTLVWHTPYYRSTEAIRKAGALAGYTYVEQGLAPSDWISLERAATQKIEYQSASRIIENLIPRLKNGAFIPIVTGLSEGTRTDYLYEKLDVLIDAILQAGYDIVPVTQLY
jgi:peptidoglycan/xylan/chitin deacetylase (PgdA/CDA1 family)